MIRRQLILFDDKSTDYRIGSGAFEELSRMVAGVVVKPKRAVLLTDTSLVGTFAVDVLRSLTDAGFAVTDLALPAGEHVATLEYASQLFDCLASAHLTRDDAVVALGGAELCALAMFCGRTWCEGTPVVLLPTTLDAMCTVATRMRPLDVHGARGAVEVPARASMVVCDLDCLADAVPDALRLGYVELLSSAFMESRRVWEHFGEILPDVLAGDDDALTSSLTSAQSARCSVVKAPNPSTRSAMEYGVFSARALQKLVGRRDVPWYRYLAEGMRFEARLAVDVLDCAVDDVFEIDDRLEDMGVEELSFDLDPADFIAEIKRQRFMRSNRFMLALPRYPGTIRLSTIDDEVLERHATAFLDSRREPL